ncbi:MAG: MarR family transcriptional regulator [Dehalococcoidia bacterium]|nr:MarR family transcriptional regulator [Dehalococcoidia bacterium]
MSSLDEFVAEVDSLSRHLMRNMECCDRLLVSGYELTASQAYALLALEELGETAMNHLASEMRLHATTMTRMVDSLVEKGLAERRQDPEDRRMVRVGLTADGREMIERMQSCKRQLLAGAFGDLSDQERDTVLKALRRLASTAEQLGSACCST